MGKLVLHIGQMKSGTTYLQNILSGSRGTLLENGWLYPGKNVNHQHETYGICGKDIFWVKNSTKEKNSQIGKNLLSEIKKYRKKKNVIISSEALSSLDSNGIDNFIEIVGWPDEVVLTLRSLHRVLPSAWQQSLKGGHDRSINEFFKLLETQRVGRVGFWKTYSFGCVVRKWAAVAPVKVIVVPDAQEDKNYLWNTFSENVGLPPSINFLPDDSKSNLSLSLETTFLLRAMIQIIKSNNKYSGHKSMLISYYLNNYVFPLSEEKRGKKILPLLEYKNILKRWSEEELALMLQHGSEIIGSGQMLIDYTGGYHSLCDDILDEKIVDYNREAAYQIVSQIFWVLQQLPEDKV